MTQRGRALAGIPGRFTRIPGHLTRLVGGVHRGGLGVTYHAFEDLQLGKQLLHVAFHWCAALLLSGYPKDSFGSPRSSAFSREPARECDATGQMRLGARTVGRYCTNIARVYICAAQMVPPAGFEPAETLGTIMMVRGSSATTATLRVLWSMWSMRTQSDDLVVRHMPHVAPASAPSPAPRSTLAGQNVRACVIAAGNVG
jgi:hypothetical protein